MTGIGVAHTERHGYMVTVELKSVNHRFKNIHFKSGTLFKPIEFKLKKKIEQEFKRGYFEISLHCKSNNSHIELNNIDLKSIENFLALVAPVIEKNGFKTEVQAVDFLRSEFMKENELEHKQTLLIEEAFEEGIQNLRRSRLFEGEKIIKAIERHRQEYQKYFNTIVTKTKEKQQTIEKKLMKKLQEVIDIKNIDKSRFNARNNISFRKTRY